MAGSHQGARGALGRGIAVANDTARRSVTADRLIDELDRLAMVRGYPAVLRCGNGPELACEATADRAGERAGLSFIPLGEPWRNGYVESFNVQVRDECPNTTRPCTEAQGPDRRPQRPR